MNRFRLICIFLALGINSWGRSGLASQVALPIDLLGPLLATYVPGEPVEFQVRLPAISNLGAYQIDLLVESSTATAGVDYAFDLASIAVADSSYVFSSSDYFAAATNVEGPNRQRLTLTDFILESANVVPGGNDQVATIVLNTSVSLHALLEIKVDALSLILDTPQIAPTPVPEFQFIQNGILASRPITLRPVPEPKTALLLLFGLVALFWAQPRIEPWPISVRLASYRPGRVFASA